MARYTGPRCRQCRTERKALYLKGSRCNSTKCPIDKKDSMLRKGPPGKKDGYRARKISDYGQQLREKQKLKRIYGVLEKQFRRYFKIANSQKGITGENLIQILERRLDNVLFRMHFSPSRSGARQMVLHGHVMVNGTKVKTPSYQISEGDVIEIRDKSKKMKIILESLKMVSVKGVMPWLEVNEDSVTGTFKQIPRRNEVVDLQDVNEQLVVELYSK
jgi:small subunit ribosomal protein S4